MKLDYKVSKVFLVVDFGSNIGFSAIYFLTRNPSLSMNILEGMDN